MAAAKRVVTTHEPTRTASQLYREDMHARPVQQVRGRCCAILFLLYRCYMFQIFYIPEIYVATVQPDDILCVFAGRMKLNSPQFCHWHHKSK
jgi:hypothetical protein